MAWGKVDDKLWGSPKWLATPLRARGLWVSALSYSMDQLTDGFVPTHVLPILGGRPADATALISAGLWEKADAGYHFHDWADYQPSRESIMGKRDAEAQRKAEWRAKRAGQRNKSADGDGDVPDVSQRDNDVSPAGVPNMSRSSRPDPTRPDPTSPKGEEEPSAVVAVAPPTRDDIDRICTHLADRIESNGSKRPVISKTWLTDARLMLDTDGRTEYQVHTAIDWCQDDDFWRSNILSMGTLRKKFDQLRLAAQRSKHTRSLDPQADLLRQEMARAQAIDANRTNVRQIGAAR